MVRPGRDRLTGAVEVDETFVGGLEPGGGRRHIGKKALVAVAAEVRGAAVGRIRLRRIADSSAESLLPFVEEAVATGSRVITDGLATYLVLPDRGYRHSRKLILGDHGRVTSLLPRVHRVASLLKRWLLGPIREASAASTSTTTSTSSRSGSTAAALGTAGCCSAASSRMRSP